MQRRQVQALVQLRQRQVHVVAQDSHNRNSSSSSSMNAAVRAPGRLQAVAGLQGAMAGMAQRPQGVEREAVKKRLADAVRGAVKASGTDRLQTLRTPAAQQLLMQRLELTSVRAALSRQGGPRRTGSTIPA